MLLAIMLAQADPHQPAHAAEVELLKCFYAQAAALDDHISSAAVIAQGVVSACHPKIDDWKYAYFEEMRPPDAQLFYRRLEEEAPSMATEIVLRVRAAKRRPQ